MNFYFRLFYENAFLQLHFVLAGGSQQTNKNQHDLNLSHEMNFIWQIKLTDDFMSIILTVVNNKGIMILQFLMFNDHIAHNTDNGVSMCLRHYIPLLAPMQPFSAKTIGRDTCKILPSTHLLHLGQERQSF